MHIAQDREIRLDILKSLALLCIFLAHVGVPGVIFQLRNFDVPLLIIISGALFDLSSQKYKITFFRYVLKRIRRVLVPTWGFLVFFFLITHILFLIIGKEYPFPLKTIIETFGLLGGIGYVWIIRVFVLLAIAAPILFKLRSISGSNFRFMLLFIYVLYELIYHFHDQSDFFGVDFVFDNYLFYILSYGVLFGLGMCLTGMRRNSVALLCSIFFLIFCCLFFSLNFNPIIEHSGAFIFTQEYKYPPRLYYLSYGIFSSLFLFYIFFNYKFKDNLFDRSVMFISRNSLWIYLWHILFIIYWKFFVPHHPLWIQNSVVKFFIILTLALMATFSQQYIIRLLNTAKYSK